MKKKIYIIWIGWIGISAIARYYLENSYEVYGSDSTPSELITRLKKEGINIIIWEDASRIDDSFELVVYTEAIPDTQSEIQKTKKLWIELLTYPESLASIANKNKLITIAWTHWKSTTTSLASLILKSSEENFTSVVWTILKEFWEKNFYHRNITLSQPSPQEEKSVATNKEYFIIEACEYKRSFLAYKPYIWVITNIDLDHLDYYKDLDDYISAFKEYIDNIVPWGFAIINWTDENCVKLIWLRKDINYIEVYDKYFLYNEEMHTFPHLDMKIPWEHILFDAHLSYIIWYMLGLDDNIIIGALEAYNWVWRRMEKIWKTLNRNTLISDYAHHPTEIKLALKSLKDESPARPILTVFQPHQYSRTLELLESFKTCFYDTDMLIIPNIYESRDSAEDKQKINSKKLIEYIKHDNKIDWDWFENTIKFIKEWDEENNFWIILLLWAWDIDDLRHKIKTS